MVAISSKAPIVVDTSDCCGGGECNDSKNSLSTVVPQTVVVLVAVAMCNHIHATIGCPISWDANNSKKNKKVVATLIDSRLISKKSLELECTYYLSMIYNTVHCLVILDFDPQLLIYRKLQLQLQLQQLQLKELLLILIELLEGNHS
jgi:hypothetical protein